MAILTKDDYPEGTVMAGDGVEATPETAAAYYERMGAEVEAGALSVCTEAILEKRAYYRKLLNRG